MGIEIPPPKGGPAVFTASSPGNRSTGELSPDEERFRMAESREDLNDGGSVSLSEGRMSDGYTHCSSAEHSHPHSHVVVLDGTIDSQHRDREEDIDGSAAAPLADNVVLDYLHFTAEPY